MELRDYQNEIIDKARSLMARGVRSILIQAPTGSGKTCLTAHMLKTAAEKNKSSWFMVHRRELIKQSIRAFSEVKVRHGVIANGFMEDPRPLVQLGSIQSMARRLHRVRAPRLIIWDECHHVAAGSWSKIFRAYPDSFHIGLTATPSRLDRRGLSEYFREMIEGPSVEWLIAQGYLSPYRLFAPGGVDVTGIRSRMGDFIRSELQTAIDKPTITGDAIKHYRRLADGKRAVVFCVSIEHSRHVVAQFQNAGIPATHVDGETPVEERDLAIRRFERNDIRVLSNVDLFGEGFDVPAIEAVIDLAPTQSLAKFLQRCGRALRPAPGKQIAIILDHAGNSERHGLPDDPDREWSLEGRESARSSTEGGSSIKICPKCFAAQFPGREVCSFCGHTFEQKAREVEEVDGELVEIDPQELRRQRVREQGRAETLEDLIKIGQERGYKKARAWAAHVFRARQAKKLAGGRAS